MILDVGVRSTATYQLCISLQNRIQVPFRQKQDSGVARSFCAGSTVVHGTNAGTGITARITCA